jgi:hypothetical protein
MAKRSYRDLFGISGKWLGLYLELFLKIKGYSSKFMEHGLITKKPRGLFAKWRGFSGFVFIFQ